MWFRPIISAIFFLVSIPALADQISTDRPGVGSDPETISQFTIQPEMGTDTKEIRFGITDRLELDKDDTSWGLKYSFINLTNIKSSIKVSYDDSRFFTLEIPANIKLSDKFNIGSDIIINKNSKTYVGEFNYQITNNLNITPTYYNDGKSHAAIFLSWIPPKHQNVQFDIGYDQKKVIVGISAALNFKDMK